MHKRSRKMDQKHIIPQEADFSSLADIVIHMAINSLTKRPIASHELKKFQHEACTSTYNVYYYNAKEKGSMASCLFPFMFFLFMSSFSIAPFVEPKSQRLFRLLYVLLRQALYLLIK
jgi:hypothetical protein